MTATEIKPPCLLSMTARDYHRDLVADRPTLSSSVASTLVSKSPLHAWLKHPKLNGGAVADEPTPEQRRGTLVHALVLGTGLDQVEVLNYENWRTKLSQEARDKATEAGKTPILKHEYDDAHRLAGDILAALAAEGVLLQGASEQVAVWEEDTAEGPVLCRGMMDHVILNPHSATVIDLKTCRSAHPKACASHVMEYGYDLQRAAYVSAIEKVHPHLAGRVDFMWAFCEELPAGSPKRAVVTLARADGVMREVGESKWKRACERWAACLKADRWPAYATDAVNLEAPAWAVKEELGV